MSIFASEPDPDPVNPPTTNPPTRHQPTRRRMTLNLSTGDYEMLERIARQERCTVHDVIRRSATTRWRIITTQHPELAYPNLDPKDLDLPGFLALHRPMKDGTEQVTRLELGL